MKVALIRLRGRTGVRKDIKDTLTMLNLHRPNYCTVVELTPVTKGMIQKVSNFITWGEVNSETEKLLLDKKGEKDPKDSSKLKKFFRLSPPRGGFDRKGIKKAFTIGGALGYRKEAINELIAKMVQ